MAIYRVITHTPLATGQKYGDIIMDGQFKPKSISGLLANNKIAPVATPPLSELPGWGKRAEKLAGIDIKTAADFLDADTEKIRAQFNLKGAYTIEKWKEEVRSYLVVSVLPKPRN